MHTDSRRRPASPSTLVIALATVTFGTIAAPSSARTNAAYYEAQDPGALEKLIAPFIERNPQQRAELLIAAFKQKRLTRVDLSTDSKPATQLWPGNDDGLAALDLSTTFRIWHLLQYGRQGLEADLWSVDGQGPLRPLTVQWSQDNVLAVTVGAVQGNGRYGHESVDGPSLEKRFGIQLRADDAKWTPDDLRALSLAMQQLTATDLTFVKDVPFVRVHQPQKANGGARTVFQAKYVPRADGPVIEVYDTFVSGDAQTFNGPLSKPLPISVGVLVHEVGHAIARRELITARGVNRERKSNDTALRESFSKGKAQLDEMNAKLKKGEAKREEVVAVADALKATNASIKQNQTDANAARKAIAAANSKGCPVEVAFARVRRPSKAVTDYGRTSVGESFAEAFKLARCDNDALKRIAPEAEAFFASEKYLEHARTRIGPPLR